MGCMIRSCVYYHYTDLNNFCQFTNPESMVLLTITLVILAICLSFFISRRLSPIPYFPSNPHDIAHIISALRLRQNQVVYDLGAGDGIVIFAAAQVAREKKLNTRFVAVEINPVLLAVLWLRRQFHPNRKNISVLRGNIFSMQYTHASLHSTFFSYISPWYLERVLSNVQRQLQSLDYISYFYPLPHWKPNRTLHGSHSVYYYSFTSKSRPKLDRSTKV